eukprot:10918558-Ditylum_brightwellii.AAC.1
MPHRLSHSQQGAQRQEQGKAASVQASFCALAGGRVRWRFTVSMSHPRSLWMVLYVPLTRWSFFREIGSCLLVLGVLLGRNTWSMVWKRVQVVHLQAFSSPCANAMKSSMYMSTYWRRQARCGGGEGVVQLRE